MTDQRSTDNTRSFILQQAEAMFGTRGYRGFSMKELAEACGLAKGSLYHHFSSKRELYLQVVEAEALALRDALTEAAGQPGTIPERIGHIAHAYLDYLIQKQYLFHIAIREGGKFEDVRQVFETHQEAIMAPLVSTIEAGIAAGLLRRLDSHLMARGLVGMIVALVRHHLLTEKDALDLAEFEATLSLYLEGAIVRT